ncbi:MAG: chromosome segregation protein SMC [Chloroflexi bacterium]|nr:MAG: chromosome segregation protein SMC [Chloroflexota bacterium]
MKNYDLRLAAVATILPAADMHVGETAVSPHATKGLHSNLYHNAMRLKRLVLQGYKTFASKTEFIFDEGITAIVGPNGSGKSNIADAIRWVLGEQSYSMLRGKRTTDMIFAGSQKRPRASMAQAILTLDNSDGWLPIDYSEVEIGRRAYRSGENEYILNGQKVRLKDITELLATSGLAERTYTMIGQGLIDQALSLRAEERRALFEEAAGIMHYKNRRAETLRRLEETQRNLQRIHDILAEIRPRLTSLKRQATRARNYEQLREDLHNHLRIWYGYKWEQAKKEMRRVREEAAAAEAAWQASRQQLQIQQDKIAAIRRELNQLQDRLTELQNNRDETREQLEKASREAAVLQERRQSLARQLAEIEAELPALLAQREAAATELAEATAELTAAQAELQMHQQQMAQFNASFEATQAEINRWQAKLQTCEQQHQTAQTKLAQAEGQLSQLQERLQEQNTAVSTTESEKMAELEQLVAQYTAVLESAQSRLDELRRQRETYQERRHELIQELKWLRREARDAENNLNKLQNNLARLEARVDLLNQMRHKETAVSPDTPTLGQFASLITIPAAHQTALEAALNHRLATLAVPDSNTLWQLINGRSDQRTLIAALDTIHPPHIEFPQDTAVLGRATDLITFDTKIAPLAHLLLDPILLVQDEQSAYRLATKLPAGSMAVTPDGLIVHAGGLVERQPANNKDSILAREKAWREAVAELETAKATVSEKSLTVTRQQQYIQEKQNEVDELQNEERRLARLEHEASQRVAQAQRNLDRARQQHDFLARQREAQVQEQKRLQERIRTLQAEIEGQKAEIVRLETAVADARTHLEALPIAEATQQRETLQQQIRTAQTIVAGRQAVVDSRRATLTQIDQQVHRLQERQSTLKKQQENLVLDKAQAEVTGLHHHLEALDEKIRPLRDTITATRKQLTTLEDELTHLQKQTHNHETHFTQARVALSQHKSEMEGLQERIKADLGIVALSYDEDQTGPTPLPMSEVVEQLPAITELPPDIEDTIQNHRAQIQRMGAINPDAPAEYEELESRYEFLTQQVEDLTETEARLRQVIAELDDLTSRAFAETVEKVNAVFGDTFKQLFGGGTARLILTDPDDLTISGVDIIARLPNRREQGLGLLSGGERSLTAAALIFSLLKVSPTPFCVMDEVDAALDEANVNRFRDLLRELSARTQFIVITHNRGTVQAAQTIYGISMGADSASQAISIKPEEYLAMAENEI